MHSMKLFFLFVRNYFRQLRRKWLSLPLLFIFPIILIGLTVTLFIAFFSGEEREAITVGLVNLDESEETELMAGLIEDSTSLSSYIQITEMTEDEAVQGIDENEISAYLVFPHSFISNLYHGESVELPIIGNPNKQAESYIVNELLESVARHIRSSQANILTINHYLKDMGVADETRNDIVFEQFKAFFLSTLGREQIMREQELVHDAHASPAAYFAISGWFIIVTLWLLIFYHLLSEKNTLRLRQRMKLYNVTELQQITAKIFVTLTVTALFAAVLFFLPDYFLWEISTENYVRIFLVSLLYSAMFLQVLALLELLISSNKLRLFVQIVLTALLLLLSGAIIPMIYFPLYVQSISNWIFSYEGFHWLTELIMQQRFYADYIPLLLMNGALAFILLAISSWKERLEQ